MIRYVMGFAFNEGRSVVVLIQKKRGRRRLVGKLNGVGGKIEPGESQLDAMVREFAEETGLVVSGPAWERYVQVRGDAWTIDCFRTFLPGDTHCDATTMTDEPVWVVPLQSIGTADVLHNLQWLIPMALDVDVGSPAAIVWDGERR